MLKMPIRALALVGLAALSLSLPARAEEVSLTAGRELATARCGRCHAVGRTGDSPNPRSPRFRDLGPNFPFDGLREALMQGMIVGHPEMPIQHLTPTESGDVVAYMRTLQERAPARQRPRKIPLEQERDQE
jgi:mono/diheme cytochrome c family protein